MISVERIVTGHPVVFMLSCIGIIAFVTFGMVCIQWSPGEAQYTGYIYSAEDGLGDKTRGHLRFSEYAGKDEQPSFCVQKTDGWKIKELAGSGKKVKVTIPAGFKRAWAWDCAIPAQVEEMDDEITK